MVAPNVDTRSTRSPSSTSATGRSCSSHPNMRKRYFVFQFLDPYTNTIGYVGTRTTGSRRGLRVLSRPTSGQEGARRPRDALALPAPVGDRAHPGKRRADQKRAYKLMRRYTLTPLKRLGKRISYPKQARRAGQGHYASRARVPRRARGRDEGQPAARARQAVAEPAGDGRDRTGQQADDRRAAAMLDGLRAGAEAGAAELSGGTRAKLWRRRSPTVAGTCANQRLRHRLFAARSSRSPGWAPTRRSRRSTRRRSPTQPASCSAARSATGSPSRPAPPVRRSGR